MLQGRQLQGLHTLHVQAHTEINRAALVAATENSTQNAGMGGQC